MTSSSTALGFQGPLFYQYSPLAPFNFWLGEPVWPTFNGRWAHRRSVTLVWWAITLWLLLTQSLTTPLLETDRPNIDKIQDFSSYDTRPLPVTAGPTTENSTVPLTPFPFNNSPPTRHLPRCYDSRLSHWNTLGPSKKMWKRGTTTVDGRDH
ncbi:hypothetical protein BGZ61DRAFT_484033 [Ilyonectria robusta]|uniref:uncharacterized protein n=1 Tax=Ilyonectria robusta TaxID=1079257 RepID=UPI001E8E9A84|nr:uncharacterized protein BGZ61DRAFT_484033 [Ilyonectria robusta]KAH8666097.1 hypothetical protein BGZ61DRAFT_484033 [Ilyonectria robusta]